jgi:4-amino-4-deoxy-L-arabinose transferase-like glycosyltransferase
MQREVCAKLSNAWAYRRAAAASNAVQGVLVAVALLLRVSLVAARSFHQDEALYSYWGRMIASGRDVYLQSVIVDKPPLFFYLLSVFFRAFGPSLVAARLPNVLASATTVFLVYKIALTLFDRQTALLSAIWMASSPLSIQLAPTAFVDPTMVFLMVLACYLALRARYEWAGLAFGLSVMTKLPAILFAPLVLGCAALAWSAEKRSLVRTALELGAGLAAPVLSGLVWDGLLRVDAINILGAARLWHGPIGPVSMADLLPRLQAWLRLLKYLTGSDVLNLALIAGTPLLLV